MRTRTTKRPLTAARSERARVFKRATEMSPDADEALRRDEAYEAWLDARIAEAIEAQDDAELVARAYGPEPEFMAENAKPAGGSCGGR